MAIEKGQPLRLPFLIARYHRGAVTESERDNARVWDGVGRGHFETWYITVNHTDSETGFWICYTVDAPVAHGGAPYAGVWFAHFDARDPGRNAAIHRTSPAAEMTARATPFELAIDGAELRHDGARGAVAGAGHEARWELAWTPARTTHRIMPPVLYRGGGLAETTVLAPNLGVAMSGTIEVDGRALALRDEPGNQSHLWGRAHVWEWAWGHCSAFEDRPGATLEALTVRLRRGGVVLPPLTVVTLYLDGDAYRWNRLVHTPLTRGQYRTTDYQLSAWGPRVRIEASFSCRAADMVATPYPEPAGGAPAWCHNTEVSDARVAVYERGGVTGRWREREVLRAPRRGHFEVGARQRDAAILREHARVG